MRYCQFKGLTIGTLVYWGAGMEVIDVLYTNILLVNSEIVKLIGCIYIVGTDIVSIVDSQNNLMMSFSLVESREYLAAKVISELANSLSSWGKRINIFIPAQDRMHNKV